MSHPKKILISRLGAIGDVVHTTVIQQTIKEKYPDCEIHFLTANFIVPLLENDPNLTKVHSFDMKKKNNWIYLLMFGLKLRKENFDVIISLQNGLRNIIMNFFASPQKVVKRNKNRVHSFDAFLNTAKDIFPNLERPTDLHLYISEIVKNKISDKTKDYPRPYIVINPGGQNDNQRQGRIWPLSHWAELSTKLKEKYGGTIFIAGSKQEVEYHKELLKMTDAVMFSGELALDESAALFASSDLFLSGDSGPLHIAAALDTYTIGLMGSTPNTASGPFGTKCFSIVSKEECVPCGKKLCERLSEGLYTPCMSSIPPERVLSFIEEKQILN